MKTITYFKYSKKLVYDVKFEGNYIRNFKLNVILYFAYVIRRKPSSQIFRSRMITWSRSFKYVCV